MTPTVDGSAPGRWDPALVPRLSVQRERSGIRFDLMVPGADAHDPLQSEVFHPIGEATLDHLLAAAAQPMQSADAASFWIEARRTGELLYRTMVPESVRPRLAAAAGGPLLVRTNLPGLPWELLHDGVEFWGITFALGTQIVTSESRPAAPLAAPTTARLRALVIGSDPDADLGFVRAEIETVVGILEPVADVHCVSGALAGFSEVSARLSEAFDLVHICGHVALDADGQPALRLPDGSTLGAATLGGNLRGRPIVFLNGCGSARRPQPGAMASLADAFLLANARAVVATLHPVRDGEAQQVATDFYAGIFAHQPIGEALRQARRRSRDRGTGTGGGLGFVLFGNPALVPLPAVASDDVASHVDTVRATTTPVTRRRVLVGIGCAGAAIALAAWQPWRGPATVAPTASGDGRLVIWIGPFQDVAGEPRVEPLGRTLSDGLAARLRNLHIPTIYSPADVPPSPAEPASEIEIVKRFRATKSVAGTYRARGDTIEATVRIVDVETGLAEPSFTIAGARAEINQLQIAIAEQIVSSLRIVRMMLEGEGIERAQPAPDPEPSSGLTPLYALFDAAAWADDGEAGVRAFLERYRAATERGDLDAVATCYVAFPDSQRASQRGYLDSVQGLRVRVDVARIDVDGERASVEYTRTDDFNDARTGRAMHVEVRLQRSLLLVDGAWRFSGAPRVQGG